MSNPHKPGTPEWQQWMNDAIAKHDAEQKERDAKIDARLKAEAQEKAEAAEKARRQAEEK
jgi:hypothetical protein